METVSFTADEILFLENYLKINGHILHSVSLTGNPWWDVPTEYFPIEHTDEEMKDEKYLDAAISVSDNVTQCIGFLDKITDLANVIYNRYDNTPWYMGGNGRCPLLESKSPELIKYLAEKKVIKNDF